MHKQYWFYLEDLDRNMDNTSLDTVQKLFNNGVLTLNHNTDII